MVAEFPYQIVVFLDRFPGIGEPVYYGKNGWYAQLAIKRRFKFISGDESDLLEMLEDYFSNIKPFNIETLSVKSDERMPVRFIDVNQSEELISLHNNLINFLGDKIISRYPERDGINYYPHVTAEYNGEDIIDVNKYSKRTYPVRSVWLLKDVEDENSVLSAHLLLKSF